MMSLAQPFKDGDALAGLISLNDESNHIVNYAYQHISEFYEKKRSLNYERKFLEVNSSPITAQEGIALLKLAVSENIKKTLEVGFGFGMSTCHLLIAHEIVGGHEHLAIDPNELSEYYQGCGLMNVYLSGLGKRFYWVKDHSEKALPRLLAEQGEFDLCFVDGKHIFGNIFIDAFYCALLLRPNGLLIIHDSFLPATRTVKNILTTNYDFVDEKPYKELNMEVLRKKGPGRTDWIDFATQFANFNVEKI